MIVSSIISSPLGKLCIIEDNEIVLCISEYRGTSPVTVTDSNCVRQIKEYFNGIRKEFNLVYRLDGTEFQKMVWRECMRIPYGHTVSYGYIAEKIGKPKAVRAVGMALSRNPILLIIPCHRVTGKNGTGGFRLGLEAKKLLLSLENKSLISE